MAKEVEFSYDNGISELFNEYFCKVSTNLQENVPQYNLDP